MNIDILKETMLFNNMTTDEISNCLDILSAKVKKYSKGELIFYAGSVIERFGLVLNGSVTIENNDVWGNKTILSHVGKKQFFAETYALLDNQPLLVDVCANENCEIMFFCVDNLNELLHTNSSWAVKFVTNMLKICANKNLTLSSRSFHTSPKTIRDRVLAYLNTVCVKNNSKEFDIPFDRQQLANYLNVDRSALSNELSKLKSEGIISCKKNHFIIHNIIELN